MTFDDETAARILVHSLLILATADAIRDAKERQEAVDRQAQNN